MTAVKDLMVFFRASLNRIGTITNKIWKMGDNFFFLSVIVLVLILTDPVCSLLVLFCPCFFLVCPYLFLFCSWSLGA